VLFEPNMSMDDLAETTMEYSVRSRPIIMEILLTGVGGGDTGASGEGSSFKYGFFDRKLNFVDTSGLIVTASRTERPDLFHGAVGSCGSLGVTTMVALQLTEAKNYGKTTYHLVASIPAVIEKTKNVIKTPDELEHVDATSNRKTTASSLPAVSRMTT